MTPAERASGAAPADAAGRIQCHFISNTHWDREWKSSAERTRAELVELLDRLLDLFRRHPEYRHFHLDSQTVPLLDYLEIRPEREAELRELVTAGRLAVGPWFTLPDEFCVAGESLIRNLLLGHRIARRFGRVCKTGYTPFSWGQISQMPQIYRGFGIDLMMFYRGINSRVAPLAEFIWEGPDGTRIHASRLAARPRYNVWYLLLRPAYWGVPLDRLNDFAQPWFDGSGLFRLIDAEHAHLDWRLLHPRYDYDASVIPAAAAQALREQDGDWRTPHRLWSCGHDSSFPDARELRLLRDAQAALAGVADVRHSTFEEFAAGVLAAPKDDWPVVRGEMRHTFTTGSTSPLLGWILSARTFVKQDNHRTERLLAGLAEPLAVFARLWGAPFPGAFLERAWRLLLTNHSHDAIGGVGRDVVHDDMLARTRQVREISTVVLENALAAVAGSVDLRDLAAGEFALLVYNPSPQPRSDVLAVALDTPADWPTTAFDVVDAGGGPVAYQRLDAPRPCDSGARNPGDVQLFVSARRHALRLAVRDVPPCGYHVYTVRPRRGRATPQPATLCQGPYTMANEHLAVTVLPNGTLDVHHPASGRTFRGLGYFHDSGATGTAWEHRAPAEDRIFTTLHAPAEVTRVHDGALECCFRIALDWRLPRGLSADGRRRSGRLVRCPIVSHVTLRRGVPWVEIVTHVDNRARDHYLRVAFPSGLRTDTVWAATPFDVVPRPIPAPDHTQFDDTPQAEQPWQGFVDLSDGAAGLALLGDGLRAYEAHDDPARTVSLTLLRSFALRFYVPDRTDDPHLARTAQCPGRHVFRYAVLPHTGDWQAADVWSAAERFNTPLLAAQHTPTRHGRRPRAGSFLEIDPPGVQVGAIKASESGAGVVVRLFNPRDAAARVRVRLGGGYAGPAPADAPLDRARTADVLPDGPGAPWRAVRQVTLEERERAALAPDGDGWVTVVVPPRGIETVEFVR